MRRNVSGRVAMGFYWVSAKFQCVKMGQEGLEWCCSRFSWFFKKDFTKNNGRRVTFEGAAGPEDVHLGLEDVGRSAVAELVDVRHLRSCVVFCFVLCSCWAFFCDSLKRLEKRGSYPRSDFALVRQHGAVGDGVLGQIVAHHFRIAHAVVAKENNKETVNCVGNGKGLAMINQSDRDDILFKMAAQTRSTNQTRAGFP